MSFAIKFPTNFDPFTKVLDVVEQLMSPWLCVLGSLIMILSNFANVSANDSHTSGLMACASANTIPMLLLDHSDFGPLPSTSDPT